MATIINDLKRILLNQFPAFALFSPNLAPPDLLLAIDGFELLGDSGIYDVIGDGDLVTIELRAERFEERGHAASDPIWASSSRLALPKGIDAITARKRKRSIASPSSNSSSSSSSSSLSSSSSSDVASEDSSPSERIPTTESISSSSSSSEPAVHSSKQPAPNTSISSKAAAPSIHLHRASREGASKTTNSKASVPPGEGKSSTHKRNNRRRLLRLRNREQHPDEVEPIISAVPAHLSTPNSDDQPHESPPNFSTVVSHASTPSQSVFASHNPAVYSVKNKTKRRGFKEASKSVVPTRIVFETQPAESSTSQSNATFSNTLSYAEASQEDESLLDDVPYNIAMTAFLNDGSPTTALARKETEHQMPAELQGVHPTVTVERGFSSSTTTTTTLSLIPPSHLKTLPSNIIVTSVDVEADIWGADVIVDRQEPPHHVAINKADIKWEALSNSWISFPPAVLDTLKSGDILAWQDVTLDFATFSPKMAIVLGRVVNVGAGASSIQLERLVHPSEEAAGENDDLVITALETFVDIPLERLAEYRIYCL